MDYKSFLTSDPGIMLGKPMVRGTRLTVELILQKLSEGASTDELLVAYPSLTTESIMAVLAYASDIVSTETVIGMA
jgi:uncharacterized protein (DUF433 family)